jgi:hypothetical protein
MKGGRGLAMRSSARIGLGCEYGLVGLLPDGGVYADFGGEEPDIGLWIGQNSSVREN